MTHLELYLFGSLGIFITLAWTLGLLGSLLFCLLVLAFTVLGAALGVSMVICTGKKYTPASLLKEQNIAALVLKEMVAVRENFQPCQRKVLTTRNLDNIIEEVLELSMRDYVLNWYSWLAGDEEKFKYLVSDGLWTMVDNLSQRCTQVDLVRYMTHDVVKALTRHFEEIRMANRSKSSQEHCNIQFLLHPWLAGEDREQEFLRKTAEVCLLHLLPDEYIKCQPVRHLLREILACCLLKPGIDLICDPDYLNQKLLGWLEYREMLYLESKRTYSYAATYEDFMKMIEQCYDIEHLKQMRYNVISEIMQATTIQNLKRAKGLDTNKESAPKGTTKGDLLRARNLNRYLNQLTVAKSFCEKRIHVLGGPDYMSYTSDTKREEHENMPGKKVLSFAVVLGSADARNHFMKYLYKKGTDALLRFWTAVENLKQSSEKHHHQMAGEIYQMYIAHPTSKTRACLDRATIKGMEAFMIGNTGPSAFFAAQNQVYHELEEHHYPSFILSDIYHKYMAGAEKQTGGMAEVSTGDLKQKQRLSSSKSDRDVFDETSRIMAHSTYVQTKLRNLNQKITNKTQALKALKNSQKPDRKMLKLLEDIDNEIETLKAERRNLEFHIDRTDLWTDNVGKWTAQISNTQIMYEEDREVPYFGVVVHSMGGIVRKPQADSSEKTSKVLLVESIGQGWVVYRKLDDFHALHHKLVEIMPSLKKRELPTVSKFRIRSLNADFLKKAAALLQDYLVEVLGEERLAHSEAVFAFCSPSLEHLMQQEPTGLQKSKSKFSLTGLLKGLPGAVLPTLDSDSDDELLFGDEEGDKGERSRDSIAEPLYRLVGEIFELHGVFNWLRRTLMVFVQVTFGRSINRQLRETVDWIFSEPMLIYYIALFRDAYWPDGKLAAARPPRTEQQKLHTRMLAKEKFLQNIPEAVHNLVGEYNMNKGAVKMFEAMQDVRLNKHICYILVEKLMFEVFPELQETRQTMDG